MLIFGIHACREAILSKKREVLKVFLQNDEKHFEFLKRLKTCEILYVGNKFFQKVLPENAVHQGIAAEVSEEVSLDISNLKTSPTNCSIAILDNITDPRNLGAIIRSAATFGIFGLILPERSSCKITGAVAKTASGGLEHVNIYYVKNLSQTIEQLKSFGFWMFSFSEHGQKFLHDVDLKGKSCLIFGSEEKGIRKIQMEKSDFIVKLPTNNAFQTLNVSVAASIAFYETAKQNSFALKNHCINAL
ncbi:23S rRNA (guanosine(2251)-2'-O)-methyltransferase RlmB [Alphaproteobacteria bacterium]|nr:23S rRNA (guanosine(2251)-2'-O)-methyltransferase RlmB [Alphaproteobacteria bacterium]